MNFYSVSTEDNRWDNTLSYFTESKKDIFYSQKFAKLAQKTIYKKNFVSCLIASNKDEHILFPVIERKYKFKEIIFFDLTSPYNLGGPIYNTENENLKNFFNEQLIEYCKKKEITSIFLRFHPVIKNNDVIYNVDNEDTGNYAIVNLKKIYDPVVKNFEYRHQKSIKKAIKSNVEIIISNDEIYFNNFFEIYYNEMKLKNANKFYFFEKDFFYSLKEYINGNYQFFYAKFENKIISCELVLYGGEFCHSYLGATNHKFKNVCSNHFLKTKIIEFFRDLGLNYFFLGGSQIKSDGIFKYKSGFSNQSFLKNTVGKIIFNKNKYFQLKEEFKNEFPEKNLSKFQFYEDCL